MSNSKKLDKMSDEELIRAYQEGSGEAADIILDKYKNLVRMKARQFFIVGADSDDLIQEGMIGLYKAIRDYDATKNVEFMYFASLCISRQLMTAVTANNRKKNIPRNNYVSLDSMVVDDGGNDVVLGDAIPSDYGINPETVMIDRENNESVIQSIYGSLSKMELQVLSLYMEGFNYVRIGEIIGKNPKAVDNAIQRIRGKINSIKLK